jgi:hypothetical protein
MSNKVELSFIQEDLPKNNGNLKQAIKQVAKEMAEAVKNSITKNCRIINNNSKLEENESNYSHVESIVANNSKPSFDHNQTITAPLKASNYFGDDIYNEERNTDYEGENNEEFFTKGRCVVKKFIMPKSNNNIVQKFYNKGLDLNNLKEHKLELLRNKKRNEELKHLKAKPDISENSKRIIKDKLNNVKPIHQRVNEVIKTKEEKLSMLNYLYNVIENEDMKELSKTRISTNIQNEQDKYDFNAFYNDQIQWLKTKQEKLIFIRSEIKKLEEEGEKKFYKPIINQQSRAIVAKSVNKRIESTTHNRLYKDNEVYTKKKEELRNKSKPSFTPQLAKSKSKIFKEHNKGKNKSMSYGEETFASDLDSLTGKSKGHFENEIIQDYKAMLNNLDYWENNNKGKSDKQLIKMIKFNSGLQDDVGNITNTNFYDREGDSNLYRLNIQDNSMWRKNKENKVMFTPTFKNYT